MAAAVARSSLGVGEGCMRGILAFEVRRSSYQMYDNDRTFELRRRNGARSALECQRQDARHQPVEVDPGRLGGLRQQARLGEAGDRIRLQHEQLTAALLDHEVHPTEALEPEQAIG